MTTDDDPRLDDTLRLFQRAVLRHPVATRALCASLAREGRAYAATEDGRRLRARLVRSEYVSRLRTAWDLLSVGLTQDATNPGRLPSSLLEGLARAIMRPAFELRLQRALRSTPSRREPPP